MMNMWIILNCPEDGIDPQQELNPGEKIPNSSNSANVMAGGDYALMASLSDMYLSKLLSVQMSTYLKT
jgi:hypothetical protein